MKVDRLRSPYEKISGILYLGRMLDKIRLHAKGELPPDYHSNLGIGFDGRCCSFLWIEYTALVQRVKVGGTDAEILEWCFQQGRQPSPEETEIWCEFLRKRGWNDDGSLTLQRRIAEFKSGPRPDIQTFFDYIDLDEGRETAVRKV